jgi:hypothetical protein
MSVHVYCGCYLPDPRGFSFFEEPPECNWEGDIEVHPDEIDFASFTCGGCGAINAVRDHEVTNAARGGGE